MSFADTDVPVPRLGRLKEGEPRDSATNAEKLKDRQSTVKAIEAVRRARYDEKMEKLSVEFDAVLHDTFWLLDGITIDMPLRFVPALAARTDVRFVSDSHGGPPPALPIDTVRTQMRTDAYYSLTSGYIGLLDTGIRYTHQWLDPTNGILADCVNGKTNHCSSGNVQPLNPMDNYWNHGTSAASEIMGNASFGTDDRGITALALDSFKVYDAVGLVSAAVTRGFEAAIVAGDSVIVANMQVSEDETGNTAITADAAFDQGVSVVAAAGNAGPSSSTVKSPGIAQKRWRLVQWATLEGASRPTLVVDQLRTCVQSPIS